MPTQQGRGSHIGKTVALVNALLRGQELDVHAVRRILGVASAGARRHMDALGKLLGVTHVRGRRGRTFRLDIDALKRPAPSIQTIVAACIASGFAPLFDGTPYANAFADVRRHVLEAGRRTTAIDRLDQKFFFISRGGDVGLRETPGYLGDLVTALLDEVRVAFEYEHMEDGRKENVRADPLSLVIHQNQLYVVARGESGRGRAWPYRYSRIRNLRVTEESFIYPGPSEYTPEKFLAESFGVFVSDRYPLERIRLRLTGFFARYIRSHQWHATQQVELDGDAAIVGFRMKVCPEVVSWVLSLGDAATVLEPESLRDQVSAAARAIAARYPDPAVA